MKFRTRLFIWIGSLFAISFVLSYFVEDYITKTSVLRTQAKVRASILSINEVKRKNIEEFLSNSLGEVQARIDSLLSRIARFPFIREEFEPTMKNLKDESWLPSSSLIITNRWVDFVQNLNEDHLSSMIVLDQRYLSHALYRKVNEDFSFVAVQEHIIGKTQKWKGPFIGIHFTSAIFSTLEQKPLKYAESKEELDEYFVYFDIDTILNFRPDEVDDRGFDLSVNLLEPFLRWISLPEKKDFLHPFIKKIQNVQKMLNENPSLIPSPDEWSEWIEESLKDDKIIDAKKNLPVYYTPLVDLDWQEKHYLSYVNEMLRFQDKRYSEIGMVWALSAFFYSGTFGNSPFSPQTPVGMSKVVKDTNYGKAILAERIFKKNAIYNPDECKIEFQDADEYPLCVPKKLSVIAPETIDRVFLVNSLKLEKEGRVGYLTLGINGGDIMRTLARGTHEIAAFVTKNRLISVFNSSGDKVYDSKWQNIPVKTILSENKGIVNIDGEEYFFLHMDPFKGFDFHFVVLNPKKIEFALVDTFNELAKALVKRISFNLRISFLVGLLVVLFILHNIANRVTKPISTLARATKTVSEGRLEEAGIPKLRIRHKDEIDTLYNSFREMIKGLQEKEKVRGILNKVVSQEIAEETLKGNVQLGGEEKKVTVLFADIRNFSEMSEKMNPQEVIQLINTCMTRISRVIDKHGGVIDKYVGDEVMALFGAPVPKEDSSVKAIYCGLEMIETLREWDREREQRGLAAIEMGVGIHTGNVVAGNMGAENRLNYTVLGANVNLASRLCSAAKGMEVLISEGTLHEPHVQDTIDVEEVEPLELKGFTEAVKAYRVKARR